MDLTGLAAFGSAVPGGYMAGQSAMERIRAQQMQNQQVADLRRASLASILDDQGVDPTTATIMALSGNAGNVAPSAQAGGAGMGAAPVSPAGQAPPPVDPSYRDPGMTTTPIGPSTAQNMPLPRGAPVPTPQMLPQSVGAPAPTPQMMGRPGALSPGIPGFGQRMSLGQMLRRLKADPRNANIPDTTLLGIAAKTQTVLHPEDQMLLQYILKNQVTPFQQQELGLRQRQIESTDKARQATEADRRERLKLTESLLSGAQLSDEDARFLAQQRIAGDRTALSGLGYGNVGAINRRKVTGAMRQILQEKYGKAGGDIIAQYTAAFMGDTAAARSLATQAARIDSAAIEMKKFAPLVEQASANIDRTRFPSLNALQLAAQRGTGGEEVIRLVDSINAFENAYAQVVTRGGASTEGARQTAREVINKNWSRGQISAAIDQLTKEANAAIEATRQAKADLIGSIGGGVGGGESDFGGDGGGGISTPSNVGAGAPKQPTVSNW